MLHLNKTRSLTFLLEDKLYNVCYHCSKDDAADKQIAYHPVWLTVEWEKTLLKVSKPETFLKQPKEVIEKIVEREVKEYLANEVIEQL
jgi:hypothetical protein